MEHIHGLDVSWMTHGNPKGSQSTGGQPLHMEVYMETGSRCSANPPKSAWLTRLKLSRQGCEECDCDDTAKIALEFGPRRASSDPGPGPKRPGSTRGERPSDR
jgi:hypothetical protein